VEYLGIDGCRGGWFLVGLDEEGNSRFQLLRHIDELDTWLAAAELVLIDIPIGLLRREPQARECDKQARRILGRPRGASVFTAPSRCALDCKTYSEANTRNRACTGRGLSRQCFGILPKIREMDAYLDKPDRRSKIHEMHPEVCFWALNKQTPMAFNKKQVEGFVERLQLLARDCPESQSMIESAMQTYPRAELARDDIVDALVGAVTARFAKPLRRIPEHPARDEKELIMEIVY
jgi:predicted RNase H-like nuclease